MQALLKLIWFIFALIIAICFILNDMIIPVAIIIFLSLIVYSFIEYMCKDKNKS
ncbi:Uncharacterised protein [Staphylococcus muscae]|uniref:Phage protein n=1 Tax=Staphylococcus muscae TaxID=1294 RepID=A0A240C9N5_9STAP|nr:hypothetical protein GCM10007183_08790 [Staphylococcus muscae]SNW03983.1 Uncharacterised protein [Staphylococcus muscae]